MTQTAQGVAVENPQFALALLVRLAAHGRFEDAKGFALAVAERHGLDTTDLPLPTRLALAADVPRAHAERLR
jgi:hypothetical protein